MGMYNLSSLYDFFQAVKQRPQMYVRDYSLDELQTMCHGYSLALDIHGVEEFGTDFNIRFHDFLFQQYGWGTARGWATDIRERVENNEAALELFFQLLEEFRSLGPMPQKTS